MPLKTSSTEDQSVVTMGNDFRAQQRYNGGYTENLGSTEIGHTKLNNSASEDSPITKVAPVKEEQAITKEERRAALKSREEARIMKQEAERSLSEARRLSSSKDALLKGDIDAVAKSYGMTKSEYIDYINRGIMSMPEKELTPEQQKTRNEEAYRAKADRVEKELAEMTRRTDIKEYVMDHITPVILENKENYKFLLHNEERKNVELFVYQYINEHYQQTGKTLNAKDVLDGMEDELWNDFETKGNFAKETERGKKYFNLEDHLTQDNSPPEYEREESAPPPPAFKKKTTLTDSAQTRQQQSNGSSSRPWSAMDRREKMASINARIKNG
jgi:hypothetical protein